MRHFIGGFAVGVIWTMARTPLFHAEKEFTLSESLARGCILMFIGSLSGAAVWGLWP